MIALEPIAPCWRPSHDSVLDPRTHAFRSDLADEALIGRVQTEKFAAAEIVRCGVDRCTIYIRPDDQSEACSEIVYGEAFYVLEKIGLWLWGWCGHDHYVGYCHAADCRSGGSFLSHQIVVRVAPEFVGPSVKRAVVRRLPLGAQLSIEQTEGEFFKQATGSFVHYHHVAPIGAYATDPVAVAMLLLGSPYIWGGRTGDGIDCSGLVQVVLGLCGIAAPRDSDQQMIALGQHVDLADVCRGDLVFFPGHVGLMTDTINLIHANAFWMSTVVEPLADVAARLAAFHVQPILAVKRLN